MISKMEKNNMFPPKQPFEKSLEKMLKGRKNDIDDCDFPEEIKFHRWYLDNLTINYYFRPFQNNSEGEYEGVFIEPNVNADSQLWYQFDFDNEYMANLSHADGGFRYKILFPDYHGPLDDEHTRILVKSKKDNKLELKYVAPRVTRTEFLKELEKIIKLSEKRK